MKIVIYYIYLYIILYDMLYYNYINSESDIFLMILNICFLKDGLLIILIYVIYWMKFGIYELLMFFSKMMIFKWFFFIYLFRSVVS